MPDFLNGLFFSELLADNAGGSAIDVNADGGTNKQDEFIEIQNNSGSVIDLEGYQIWSDSNGLLHTFQAGDEIASGGTATVVGSYNNPPAGFYGANGNNNSASSNGGFLEDGEGNKNDTIYLVDPDGNYIILSYGQPAQDPGDLPAGFPAGGIQQGVGESIDSGAPNGTAVLRDSDGNLIEGTPTPGIPGPVCFKSGTLITTENGDVVVDILVPGTRVLTRDGKFEELLALRHATIGRTVLNWNPDVRPIVIPSGEFGNQKTLYVSPAHCLFFKGPILELLFGVKEALVPTRQLVGHNGIRVDQSDKPVTYYHLLFENHEVVKSDGCWSESLFLGDTAHAAIATQAGWKTAKGVTLGKLNHNETACRVLKRYETNVLMKHMHELEVFEAKVS